MEHVCPFIILVSGTPGTGKSTLAKHLCARSGWDTFTLGEFIIEHGYYVSESKERNTKTIDVDKAAQMGAREILTKFINSSVVIIDSHYADIVMDGFLDMGENMEKNCVSSYVKETNIAGIVLRCHPRKLQERLMERNYSPNKIMENIQAEILSESTQNVLEVLSEELVLEINTSNQSTSNISTAIYEWYKHHMDNKSKRAPMLQNVGEIDWIKELSKEGTLEKYFVNDFGEKTPIEMGDFGDDDV